MSSAKIGIIGGSGLYELFGEATEVSVDTPYGAPSAPIQLSRRGDKEVAFLPRHGRHHEFAPHLINYRANLYALKSLGVNVVVGLNCAGSLVPHIRPGDIVICDDFIDYTSGRIDSYVNTGDLICLGMQNVFSGPMRAALIRAAKSAGITVHETGTAAVINGPRLSTRSESKRYAQQGCHIVNMTQYPECYLARELGIAYASATLITDFDIGVSLEAPVALGEMKECFKSNLWKLKDIVAALLDEGSLPIDHVLPREHRDAVVTGEFFRSIAV